MVWQSVDIVVIFPGWLTVDLSIGPCKVRFLKGQRKGEYYDDMDVRGWGILDPSQSL